jgi:hypothetical protein
MLLHRNPPNDESSFAVELPTEVSETQERKGFGLPLPTVFPVSGSKPPEFNQSCSPARLDRHTESAGCHF